MVAAKPGVSMYAELAVLSRVAVLATPGAARTCTPEWGYQPRTHRTHKSPAESHIRLTLLPGLCVCICIEKSCECPRAPAVPVSIPHRCVAVTKARAPLPRARLGTSVLYFVFTSAFHTTSCPLTRDLRGLMTYSSLTLLAHPRPPQYVSRLWSSGEGPPC